MMRSGLGRSLLGRFLCLAYLEATIDAGAFLFQTYPKTSNLKVAVS